MKTNEDAYFLSAKSFLFHPKNSNTNKKLFYSLRIFDI